MFIEIYKCKLCEKKISKTRVNDVVADVELLKKKDQCRHFCKNGDKGVAEFIGYKKVDI